jgi:hypothetical protein
MGKALDFIDPDRLSMTVILTAMNRFINEADGGVQGISVSLGPIWLLLGPLIISARYLEIWTQTSLASTRTKSC